MEIKRLGTTKLTVKFNTKYTAWNDTQTDFIGIEGEARSRCYSFKIQDAEGINFISENVKMLFKERGSSKVYFSKAVWNPEEENYYCDIPGNILQKTQIIDIQVCVEDGRTRILTPVITKQVLSSLMSGAAASSGNDIYIDFENLNDIQKIIDSEEERKKNELERIEDSKRIKDMLDTNLDSELKKYAKVDHRHDGQVLFNNVADGKKKITKIATIERLDRFADSEIRIKTIGRLSTINTISLKWFFGDSGKIEWFYLDKNFSYQEVKVWIFESSKNIFDLYITNTFDNSWQTVSILNIEYWDKYYKITTHDTFKVDDVPEGAIEAIVKPEVFATKTELVSQVNILNGMLDKKAEKNHDHAGKFVHFHKFRDSYKYHKVATITKSGDNTDQPIFLKLYANGTKINDVTIVFDWQASTTKPKLFTSTTDGNLWLKKESNLVWTLYAEGYGSSTWNSWSVLEAFYYPSRFSLNFKDDAHVSAIPPGAIKVTLGSDTEFITKAEYAKDRKRLNATIAREKKLETLAGLILEELRKQSPDLQPIDVANILKLEGDEE